MWRAGSRGNHAFWRLDLITISNWEQFWKAGKGVVESEAMSERRPKPMGTSKKRLRIAILGLEDNPFWVPIREGAMAAAAELRPLGADVEWIVPEPSKTFVLETRAEFIDGLVAKGYDAIATPINDTGLVACINRAVAAGVTVASFNAESSSLRGLMDTLSHRAQRLMSVSSDLAAIRPVVRHIHSRDRPHRLPDGRGRRQRGRRRDAGQRQHPAHRGIRRRHRRRRPRAGRAADSLSQTAAHIARAVEAAETTSQSVVAATSQAKTTPSAVPKPSARR